jgi:uncharacterized protein (TIGR02186 family)
MKRFGVAIAALLLLLTGTPARALDPIKLTVTPNVLNIDAFYNGTTLTASGTAPSDSQIVLRFVGASCDLHMKERGKVFGVMWMNLDSLVFKNVPSVCLVSSAVDLGSLGGHEDQARQAAIRELGLSGITDTAQVESKGIDRETALGELLRLKQNEGLYRETVGNVTYGTSTGSTRSFKADIPIPSRLTPGDYLVEVSAINNGLIVARAREPVRVNLAGFPAMLARLAFGHAALYGVLATVIAILAGLAVGLVFQSKGAH